jgi:hypothetical protein
VSTPSDITPDEAIRSVPHVRSVTLQDDGSGPKLAVVIIDAVDHDDRPALREEIVRKAAGAGVAVRPAIYDAQEWDEVGRLVPTDAADVVTPALARHSAEPGELRRAAIRIVRDLRMAVDSITEPQPIPYHQKLGMCAGLVREGMRILFAMKAQAFTADAAAVAAFDREFVADGFPARHGTLFLRLSGLARQAELGYWATARDDEGRFPADAEFEEAADFLRLLERHLGRMLTSESERAHADRMKRLGVAAIGPLVAVLGLAYLAAMQPQRPLANTGGLTAPGAIGVEYFAGATFDHKILERADDQIAVLPDAPSPDPRLQAEHWSARWNGYLHFDQPGRWHLCGRADDGQRIYLNNRLLVDDWTHAEMRTACATVKVQVGWYPFRVEYHQSTGPAALSVLRGPPRRSLAAIPASSLCCGPNTPVARSTNSQADAVHVRPAVRTATGLIRSLPARRHRAG